MYKNAAIIAERVLDFVEAEHRYNVDLSEANAPDYPDYRIRVAACKAIIEYVENLDFVRKMDVD